MVLALVRRSGAAAAKPWLGPYLPMLRSWTDELVRTTLFPANQICTDDFTGALANNTNLGQKGIIAIAAYAELCSLMGLAPAVDCAKYNATAKQYAATWERYAYNATGPHYKMSYNDLKGIPNSWSFKYNLLWQRLLRLEAPFDFAKIAKIETDYYRAHANAYGTPMDPRHGYVKADWLSWVASMAPDDAGWRELFEPIFTYLNTTESREPFTDLYDTVTAKQTFAVSFVARPVVGGLFAKMLV